ncbi:MAG: hypothetical protein AB8E15_05510 [Bdellovibrionales bacterium]
MRNSIEKILVGVCFIFLVACSSENSCVDCEEISFTTDLTEETRGLEEGSCEYDFFENTVSCEAGGISLVEKQLSSLMKFEKSLQIKIDRYKKLVKEDEWWTPGKDYKIEWNELLAHSSKYRKKLILRLSKMQSDKLIVESEIDQVEKSIAKIQLALIELGCLIEGETLDCNIVLPSFTIADSRLASNKLERLATNLSAYSNLLKQQLSIVSRNNLLEIKGKDSLERRIETVKVSHQLNVDARKKKIVAETIGGESEALAQNLRDQINASKVLDIILGNRPTSNVSLSERFKIESQFVRVLRGLTKNIDYLNNSSIRKIKIGNFPTEININSYWLYHPAYLDRHDKWDSLNLNIGADDNINEIINKFPNLNDDEKIVRREQLIERIMDLESKISFLGLPISIRVFNSDLRSYSWAESNFQGLLSEFKLQDIENFLIAQLKEFKKAKQIIKRWKPDLEEYKEIRFYISNNGRFLMDNCKFAPSFPEPVLGVFIGACVTD